VMDKSKVKKTFGLEIPYWRDSLVSCLSNLKSQSN
jgi:dTDP-4-dehydrorhamnose reductase